MAICPAHLPCYAFFCHEDGDDKVFCDGSGTDCVKPKFATGKVTNVHTQHLADATQKIIEVLNQIPPDPDGRSVSFVKTTQGFRLAWVYNAPRPANAAEITDEGEIAKLLGID